jgi:hypothetical protein
MLYKYISRNLGGSVLDHKIVVAITVITSVKTQQTAKAGTMLLEGRTMNKISIAIKLTIAALAIAALVLTPVS